MQRHGHKLPGDQRVVGKRRIAAVVRDWEMPKHIRLSSEQVRGAFQKPTHANMWESVTHHGNKLVMKTTRLEQYRAGSASKAGERHDREQSNMDNARTRRQGLTETCHIWVSSVIASAVVKNRFLYQLMCASRLFHTSELRPAFQSTKSIHHQLLRQTVYA